MTIWLKMSSWLQNGEAPLLQKAGQEPWLKRKRRTIMGKDLSREIVWVKDENADIPGYVQNSTNIIVVDHKGSLYCKYKDTLEQEGYKVKCLDLNHPEEGNHYNPFHYIHNIDDIEALVDAIIESERPIEALASETIESEMPAAGPWRWRKQEKLLSNTVFSYVDHHDDLELENIVHDKFAVFILLPKQGKEYDILSTMLYCQASRLLS